MARRDHLAKRCFASLSRPAIALRVHASLRVRLVFAAAMLWATSVSAGSLFDDAAPLDVRLVGALDALLDDARSGGEQEFPFKLEVDGHSIDVKVRARGKSRRETCSFPPLRLNFEKGSVRGTPFEGEKKLKLVTRCKKADQYANFVLEEYAIYRMLNVITPESFRVRRVNVGYQQAGKDAIEEQHRSFVLEDDKALAKRMGGKVVEVVEIPRRELDPGYTTTMAVFQFLIANFDWSSVRGASGGPCCHNGEPVRIGEVYRVPPYDFDRAGIINTPYADPNPAIGVHSVRQRQYRGFCVDRTVLDASLEQFRASKAQLLAVYDAIPELPAGEVKDQKAYVESFYKIIADAGSVERELVKDCRK